MGNNPSNTKGAKLPVTGVSWRLLYKIAEKGDFKSRVVPKLTTEKSPARPGMIRKYGKDLQKAKPNDNDQPTD
jgi:hypothetical protein